MAFSDDWSAVAENCKQNFLSCQIVDSLSDEDEDDGDEDAEYEGKDKKKVKKDHLVGRFSSHLRVALALIKQSEHCQGAEEEH